MHALLILGGKESPIEKYAKDADIIICADKGADYALRQNINPDIVLGDMDSVLPDTLKKLKQNGSEILEYPVQKDKTDGEIAIDYAKQRGVESVSIICAEGSIDHYLGNLYLLIYSKKLSIDARLETLDMSVYAVDDEISLKGTPGTRISILPAEGNVEIQRTCGLYYEITKPLNIECGQTIGLGNHMTGSECTVIVSKGTAFIFTGK